MKDNFYICAYMPNGKFSHYLGDTFSFTRKNSVENMLEQTNGTIDWKGLRAKGVRCIKITIQPAKYEKDK